ncbi:hypothetical protein ACN09X_04670 [Aliarcobacter butzleri]|uniref:hypothetical protein n=1 Tax=Aliarcobacter butzleri TaxID=28197 RepID=UPI003AD9F308
MYKVIAKLIGNTERTIFTWKKENRSIINFLEKYFSEEDLEEYLRTGKIDRLENPYNDKIDELEKRIIKLEEKYIG